MIVSLRSSTTLSSVLLIWQRDAIKSAFNEFANEDGEIGLERLKKVI